MEIYSNGLRKRPPDQLTKDLAKGGIKQQNSSTTTPTQEDTDIIISAQVTINKNSLKGDERTDIEHDSPYHIPQPHNTKKKCSSIKTHLWVSMGQLMEVLLQNQKIR